MLIDKIIQWFKGEAVVTYSEYAFVEETLRGRIAELEADNAVLSQKLRAAARANSKTRQANVKAAPVKKVKR